MAKPEWGIKRVCQSCATLFYDFDKSPIICPSCGTGFDPEAVLKSRRNRAPIAEEPKPARPKAKDADDPDLEDDDEDEDEDEVLEDEDEDDEILPEIDDEDPETALAEEVVKVATGEEEEAEADPLAAEGAELSTENEEET